MAHQADPSLPHLPSLATVASRVTKPVNKPPHRPFDTVGNAIIRHGPISEARKAQWAWEAMELLSRQIVDSLGTVCGTFGLDDMSLNDNYEVVVLVSSNLSQYMEPESDFFLPDGNEFDVFRLCWALYHLFTGRLPNITSGMMARSRYGVIRLGDFEDDESHLAHNTLYLGLTFQILTVDRLISSFQREVYGLCDCDDNECGSQSQSQSGDSSNNGEPQEPRTSVRLTDTFASKTPLPKHGKGGRDWMEREAYIHLNVGEHKNIAKLEDYDPINYAIVTLRIKGGTLNDRLNRGFDVSTYQRLKWAIQIFDAIHHLHSHHIVHGDLHIDNFLVDDQNQIKLIDFSASCFVEGHEPSGWAPYSHLTVGGSNTCIGDLTGTKLRLTMDEVLALQGGKSICLDIRQRMSCGFLTADEIKDQFGMKLEQYLTEPSAPI